MLCETINEEGVLALGEKEVAVLAVGINQDIESEGRDRWGSVGYVMDSEDILLPKGQRALIDMVLQRTRAKVVLVLFSGCGAMDLSAYQSNDRVIGIVSAGYAGMMGGQAIAEVLAGVVNPSRRRRAN